MRTSATAPLRRLLVLAALLLPGAAMACGPYRVAFYEYAIVFHRDTDGQYRGIDKDVLDELARRTGWRFDTVLGLRQQDAEFQAHEAVVWAPAERVVGALAMPRERVSEADRARLREARSAMRRDGSLDAMSRRRVGDKLALALRLPDGDSGH